MNIALLGYGKMGKAIETIAIKRGHEIVLKVSRDQKDYSLKNVDVAIDFSLPSSAFENISNCFQQHTPIISGTTGWLEKYDDAVALCNQNKGTFLYASNFSLGVNIFFEVNNTLAKLMKSLPQYEVGIEEIHHIQKLDSPSGTAITLAEEIIKQSDYKNWTLETAKPKEIGILAKRIENVPGTHEIKYESEVDSISIKHTAHSREGFALGAVIAAEWIHDKTGVYTMKDVLNIG
ncbi:4-hydroxy-tetrahydrodipicolinate reductase [Psychroserpens jangbogonensis]|uniref:4-hydroxy-tetrahydrodipicolinate reductase n=1 Tax=Psychroserpens jangbogonensis TaxID=1484460 RepID=UPI00053D1918|nr:4-hydroxy-tetrahydrodipicolinate reductase [Psychroserpens jangbogonensis]